MLRKTMAYLLVVAMLANVGCSNMPFSLPNVPFPVPQVAKDVMDDVAMRQVATMWKADIPIKHTEHTLYPTVERLPGTEFTPTTLPLANLEDTTPIEPGDYEIPAHFYCTGLYMDNGSGYGYGLAKLEGKFAEALTQLYVRASQAGTPTSDVQVLSWSMQAGVAYEDLGARSRALVDRLIPEYRAQMQLGLTEKLMRDWNTWSSRLPVPSFNDALANMGEVGAYVQTLMRARQEIINKNYNYHALSSVFVIPYDAPVPIDKEKSTWSRIRDRIYMRFVAPQGALHDGVIHIRIVDGHSQHQHPPNMALVTEDRLNRGADACALSESLDCTQHAIGAFERLAELKLAQVAFAGSSGPDNLTPAMIAQGVPPITAGDLIVPISDTIAIPINQRVQALTTTPREWPRLTPPEVGRQRDKCDSKCGVLEAGGTECEYKEGLATDNFAEAFTGNVITVISDENPCTRPSVELHEKVHAATMGPICRSTHECLVKAGSDQGRQDKCMHTKDFLEYALTFGMECSAYKISENSLRERKSAPECTTPEGSSRWRDKMAEEQCYRECFCKAS